MQAPGHKICCVILPPMREVGVIDMETVHRISFLIVFSLARRPEPPKLNLFLADR